MAERGPSDPDERRFASTTAWLPLTRTSTTFAILVGDRQRRDGDPDNEDCRGDPPPGGLRQVAHGRNLASRTRS